MSALLLLCAALSTSCLVFLLSSSFAHAQEIENSMPCHTDFYGIYYNFSVLQGTQISGADPANQWHYYLNLCTVAPACRRDGAMACQQSAFNPQDLYDVAYPNDDVAIHYWSLIPGGVQLTAFGSGIYCQNQGDERKGVVNILCDTNYDGPVTAFSGPVMEGPPCTYTMTINHTSACGSPMINTTTPAPTTLPPITAPGTDQSAVTGAGVGVGIAIGCSLVVVSVLVYVYVARRRTPDGRKWNNVDEVNLGTTGSTNN